MSGMRWKGLVAGVLTFALAGSAALAQTAGVVKLGYVGSLTGPHSGWDVPALEGMQMAVTEINGAGGFKVGGKAYRIEIVQEDAQSKPDAAATAAQKLLSDEDIHVVMGVLTSVPGVPVATQMAKAKVMYIGGFTAMDGIVGKPGNELSFRALDTDDTVAKGFVPVVVKELGLKKIGILVPNDDVSKTFVKAYQPLFNQAGVEVSMVEFFQPGTTDFAPVLRKFQGKGLDSMFIGYADPDAEAIIRQSLEVGDLPKKFVYRGGSGAPAVKYADKIDGFVWQILTRDLASSSDEKVKAWIDRYKAATKKDIVANTYWALTFYDAVFMLGKAMDAAGTTTDQAAIAAKLKGMVYDGVRRMSFDKDGHAVTDVDIGIIKGGKTYSIPEKVL
ncbi:ABC transporter substrate-binding protein [Bradyrhizobium jicamae]|uniref:ABC transporter substrate-binding protein n=1 Tax=Bradyrhizobium jicamae TaxID=280332 RepID=A0ABS5FWA4_9BRAD|nr:ABC transporter substrate-binding protein [Bradyrhizobium jicamae]MBR0801089.1 ABC transporter substrate-binding protein [Bradyrhizobium jicamae]